MVYVIRLGGSQADNGLSLCFAKFQIRVNFAHIYLFMH